MYNRCRRLHALLATSLHGLHLQRFIEDVSIKDDTLAELQKWVAKKVLEVPPQLKELAKMYHQYCKETVSGNRGKTAQYWMIYCTPVEQYFVWMIEHLFKIYRMTLKYFYRKSCLAIDCCIFSTIWETLGPHPGLMYHFRRLRLWFL